MVQPGASDTSAVRATFLIDPQGILRAMVYYPMSNGRSVDEFVRLLMHCKPATPTRLRHPRTGTPVIRSSCHRRRPLQKQRLEKGRATTTQTGISARKRSKGILTRCPQGTRHPLHRNQHANFTAGHTLFFHEDSSTWSYVVREPGKSRGCHCRSRPRFLIPRRVPLAPTALRSRILKLHRR